MANSRRIDHIVLAVTRLDHAARRYEALGFTLTSRAQHDGRMGTANRLAQFAGGNFLELLEVDRPGTLEPHDFSAAPPRFSFGAHNRDFIARREGISTLVLSGSDSRADLAAFRASGLDTYAPFDFERQATMPDGTQVTVAVSLAFVTSPDMPQISFFTCHHKTPQYFWKPAFQDHANGAHRIAAAYLVAEEPERHRDFLAKLTGAAPEALSGGLRFACGTDALIVLNPSCLHDIAPGMHFDLSDGPQLAGFTIETTRPAPPLTPAGEACGAFIEWRRI
jgi:hypothetical protein